MSPDTALLTVVMLLMAVPPSLALNFTVGYLYADRTSRYVKVKQGRIISGAMTHAINTVSVRSLGIDTFVYAQTYPLDSGLP